MRSPVAWGELPCAECGTYVTGITPGDRCRECTGRRRRVADALGRKVAIVATIAYGAWVLIAEPSSPTWLVAMGAPVTYLSLRVIVGRLAMELRQ
jgi:hypothetical protein